MVLETILTHSKEGYLKFQGGGGSQKPKESMNQNWMRLKEGGGGQYKPKLNPPCRGGNFLEQHYNI